MDALTLPPAPLHYTVPMVMSPHQHPYRTTGHLAAAPKTGGQDHWTRTSFSRC